MTIFCRILGITLATIAIVCLGISIFQDRQNRLYLPVGLLCNSFALLIFLYATKKKRK